MNVEATAVNIAKLIIIGIFASIIKELIIFDKT